jgi:diaminohydroxyphosphoribosylaminopyrimidine deaminase / 5-amino-6-(5-phosphoribosylamino)uracil reductase
LTTAYSREVELRDHAEEAALNKLSSTMRDLRGATIYSSLEPCSVRLSGRKSCAALIAESGICRVVFAAKEPKVFVTCQTAQLLKASGVAVEQLADLEPLVRQINRHLSW